MIDDSRQVPGVVMSVSNESKSWHRLLAPTLALAAVSFLGCAASQNANAPAADQVRGRQFSSSAWNGTDPLLRIYYPTGLLGWSSGIALVLKLDERQCKVLPNGSYLEIPLTVGNHTLTSRNASISVVAKPGQVTYVRAYESGWGRNELTIVSQEVGVKEISQTDPFGASDLPPFTCDGWPQPFFNDPAAARLSDAEVAILRSANERSFGGECRGYSCSHHVYTIRRIEDGELLYTQPPSSHPYGYKGMAYWFRLSPGRYEITYQTDPTRYVDMEPNPETLVTRTDTVELQAGHVYRAQQQFTCRGLKALFRLGCNGHWSASGPDDGTVWIEDMTTGQIVAGEKWY